MIPASQESAHAASGHARDWRRQWRESIVDPHELLQMLELDHLRCRLPVSPPHGFPLRVPRAFVARMRLREPSDPLLRQVLPLDEENLPVAGFGLDPVGDLAARAGPGAGVLQKYHGRALLIATGSCAVHCRYCFRRHFPYGEETAARGGWRDALAWLRDHEAINEVILSGGDPLSLATHRLSELTAGLRALPGVTTLRIHTRLPVVLPARVDDELCEWLAALPLSKVIVIHANHANEFDEEVDAALLRLRQAGCVLLNQSVLLQGVNDSLEALSDLSRRLLESRVMPYYLHALDTVAGAAHFAVDDARAKELMVALRNRLPGYLVPRLVREIEGQESKSPLEPVEFPLVKTESEPNASKAVIRRLAKHR